MKILRSIISIIILCGVVTFGYTAAFAAGIQVQAGDGLDYYLKYIPPAVTVTRGLTDEQILKRLVKRIEQLNSVEPEDDIIPPAGADAQDAGPASLAGLQTEAAGNPSVSGIFSAGSSDAFTAGADTAAAGAQDAQPEETDSPDIALIDGASVLDAALEGFGLPIFINITSPNGDSIEIVYKNTYSICGVRDDDAPPDEPIILFLTRYDAKSDTYVELADINGEKKWVVGSNGVFTRSVLLEEGENNFAIVACKATVIDAARVDGRFIEDADIQVETFVILYRSQNVAEKISEVFKELTFANILKEIENK